MTTAYHHGNLRASLVEAGVELARSAGPDGVVLREVARRTGVSHNAAYRHFADRDDLLGEIAGVAMERLAEAMQEQVDAVATVEPVARAQQRLRATGRAYVEFAIAETGLFDVAFAQFHPGEAPGETGTPPGPFDLLIRMLDEGVEAGAVSPERREGAEVLCWSAVHGFATLHAHGPLGGTPQDERRASLETMLDGITRSLAPVD